MALMLLKERRFPDYYTYKGPAQEDAIEYYSLSVLDPTWLINDVIEAEIDKNGYKPILARVYRETLYNLFGYDIVYKYRLEYIFHGSPGPAVMIIIYAILVIIALFILYLVLTAARDIIWGPPGAPPIIPIAICLLAGAFLIGVAVKASE